MYSAPEGIASQSIATRRPPNVHRIQLWLGAMRVRRAAYAAPMPARVRLALMAAATMVLVAGATRPDIPARDFVLRDQDGRRVALSSLRGQVVILTFLYTTCRDTCPITAQQIAGALDRFGRDVPVLAVSVDPAHDTPALARRFLVQSRLAGRMRFLLGTRAQLAPVWRDYGIRPQGAGFEHSAYVLLLDRQGRQRVGFPVDRLTPEGLAHDLRRLS
jgi:protein SCO1/2